MGLACGFCDTGLGRVCLLSERLFLICFVCWSRESRLAGVFFVPLLPGLPVFDVWLGVVLRLFCGVLWGCAGFFVLFSDFLRIGVDTGVGYG